MCSSSVSAYFQVLSLSKTVYFAFFFSSDIIFDAVSWVLGARQVLVANWKTSPGNRNFSGRTCLIQHWNESLSLLNLPFQWQHCNILVCCLVHQLQGVQWSELRSQDVGQTMLIWNMIKVKNIKCSIFYIRNKEGKSFGIQICQSSSVQVSFKVYVVYFLAF